MIREPLPIDQLDVPRPADMSEERTDEEASRIQIQRENEQIVRNIQKL